MVRLCEFVWIGVVGPQIGALVVHVHVGRERQSSRRPIGSPLLEGAPPPQQLADRRASSSVDHIGLECL